jgi:UDP-4-amino-4-deoxy-L-arabinose formyltransferase/UDP-glucuronic acid dehydrogenase (UDP-4-keto-hexauronic acid decarboxylating)
MTTVVNGFTATDIIVNNLNVCGIITLDRTAGSELNEYYDFEVYCERKKIAYIPVESYSLKNENDRSRLSLLDIDILLVLGWQRLIPEWLIELCSLGAIGMHGSPWGITAGRGRSPQNWALLLGMKKFYISIFWIDAKADSGAVIDTTEIDYTDTDDINSSYLKCSILTADLIIKNIRNNRIALRQGTKQEGETFYLPQRIADDGKIDWNREGKDIYNFVRALTKPYPGAFTKLGDEIIYIWHVVYLDIKADVWSKQAEGTIVQIQPNGQLIVKCKNGFICVDNYETKNNFKMCEGDLFESANFCRQIDEIVERHYSKHDSVVNPAIEKLRS